MKEIDPIINFPERIEKIITGRSTTENWLKNNYPEFYEYINVKYFYGLTINEKIYMFYNNMSSRPVCKTCGAPVKFINYSRGFAEHCSKKCTQKDKNVRNKYHNTCIKLYGDDCFKKFTEKVKQTKKIKYGDENYNNSEKSKMTCLERYGVDNPMKYEKFKEKSIQTCLKKYGTQFYLQSNEHKCKFYDCLIKSRSTCLERYGVDNPMKYEKFKEKANYTCLNKYGCMWNCMRKEAHTSNNVESTPNMNVRQLLEKYNIEYTIEYSIGNYVFDFKVDNTLIEINPYATHNINWSPYGESKIDKNYHQLKTAAGKAAGYRVINIWDWDDCEMIIKSLWSKQTIYARKCEIRKIKNKKEINSFLNKYHFQGNCKNQSIVYGLYYNNVLVQLMSFGKPRYNKNYEYELLRLCTAYEYRVVGGAQRLFQCFVNDYKPESIISYCDESKFSGKIYEILNFKIKSHAVPSKHWYKHKGNIHITDNLLRQKGYDKLFNTNHGKGTSNRDLMLENKFVEIYDAGQTTWIWQNS